MKNLPRGFLKSYNFIFLIKKRNPYIKFCQKITLWSRHLYHETYKLSKNFTEGNTRKVSTCFLCLHVCDVIQFWNDHARMRINGLLASFGASEREKYRVNLQATLVNIATRFWRWKFRMRNSYPMDRMSSILHMSRRLLRKFDCFLLCFLAAVFCYVLFSRRHFVLRASSSDYLTCKRVTSWLISLFIS